MTIYYRDEIGTVAVEVNEYGIDFDHDNARVIFEDINDKSYKIQISDIVEIVPYAVIPRF
jgi:hypothetical protein